MPARAQVRSAILRASTSTAARRVIPARAAFAVGHGVGLASELAKTQLYRDVLDAQRRLLEYTPRADEYEQVARATIAELAISMELLWRPWQMMKADAIGLHHLRDAQKQGRGVVLSFAHYSMPYAMFPVLANAHIDAWYIAGPQHYDEPRPSYQGRSIMKGRTYIDLLGEGHGIPRNKSFERGRELLEQGVVLGVAFDLPGSMPTPFLGRMITLASGSANLAVQTGALVVPMVIQRRGTIPVAHFAPPIDPADHDSAEQLQAELAKPFEAWTIERPHESWPMLDQPGPPLVNGPPLADAQAVAASTQRSSTLPPVKPEP